MRKRRKRSTKIDMKGREEKDRKGRNEKKKLFSPSLTNTSLQALMRGQHKVEN